MSKFLCEVIKRVLRKQVAIGLVLTVFVMTLVVSAGSPNALAEDVMFELRVIVIDQITREHMGGVPIEVYSEAGVMVARKLTDANGMAVFTLTPGRYDVNAKFSVLGLTEVTVSAMTINLNMDYELRIIVTIILMTIFQYAIIAAIVGITLYKAVSWLRRPKVPVSAPPPPPPPPPEIAVEPWQPYEKGSLMSRAYMDEVLGVKDAASEVPNEVLTRPVEMAKASPMSRAYMDEVLGVKDAGGRVPDEVLTRAEPWRHYEKGSLMSRAYMDEVLGVKDAGGRVPDEIVRLLRRVKG